jgi:hypothetical protein
MKSIEIQRSCLDMVGVGGSSPLAPTKLTAAKSLSTKGFSAVGRLCAPCVCRLGMKNVWKPVAQIGQPSARSRSANSTSNFSADTS